VNQKTNSENRAGWNTREMAEKRRKLRRNLGLSACVLIISATYFFVHYLLFGHPALLFIGCGTVLFLLFIFTMDRTITPVLDELFSWEWLATKGAKAEEKIGDVLSGLPGECVVLHDVNKEYGNIDHLAFRKDGAIFLIETKSHHGNIAQQNGELCRNGRQLEKNFIGQTHRNVYWLKEFLKTRLGFEPQWVHAVIVFSNAYVEKHLEIKGVAVINVSFLSEWIRRQPGNAKVAATLWPEVENLKNELSSFAPNRLARQPALN
jgi:hypothetical protein